MKTNFLLASCFLVCGCVSIGQWDKPSASSDDFATDSQACKSQAMASSAPMVLGNSVYASCMKGKGWSKRA